MLGCRVYLWPHFTDGRTKAQGSEITCPTSLYYSGQRGDQTQACPSTAPLRSSPLCGLTVHLLKASHTGSAKRLSPGVQLPCPHLQVPRAQVTVGPADTTTRPGPVAPAQGSALLVRPGLTGRGDYLPHRKAPASNDQLAPRTTHTPGKVAVQGRAC